MLVGVEMNKTVIVTTTINVPVFLETICKNAVRYSRKDFSFMIIGDIKTPNETRQYCKMISDKFNVDIKYLDIPDQEKALLKHRELLDFVPLNHSARKTVGNFLAYLDGCESIIALDDDNYATETDFIGYHSIVGKEIEINVIHSESGWYNTCEQMIEKNRIPFYPRGYPWAQRFLPQIIAKERKKVKVIINEGMVLGDPDIDAVSRLFWPIETIAMDSEFEPCFGLSSRTWAPFNDQNTAFCRELIPVYFKPLSTGRNGDIWTAFVIAKLAGHLGDTITHGQPLARQIRNYHDICQDYKNEELTNRTTDQFVSLLQKVQLTKETYIEAIDELIDKCLELISNGERTMIPLESRHHQAPKQSEWVLKKQEEFEMINNFFTEYRLWIQFISKVVDK